MNKVNSPILKDKVESHSVWFVLKIIVATILTTGTVVSGITLYFANEKIERERFESNKQISILKDQIDKLKQELEQQKSLPATTQTKSIDTANSNQVPNIAIPSPDSTSTPAVNKQTLSDNNFLTIGSYIDFLITKGGVKEYYFDGIGNKPVAFTFRRTGESYAEIDAKFENSTGQSMSDSLARGEVGGNRYLIISPPKNDKYKITLTGTGTPGNCRILMSDAKDVVK